MVSLAFRSMASSWVDDMLGDKLSIGIDELYLLFALRLMSITTN